MTTVKALADKAIKFRNNPSAIMRATLSALEQTLDSPDRELVDASNPFMNVIETAVTLASSAMIHNDTNSRRQYPILAQSEEELYLHMSDADYVGRFATPARAVFSLLLDKNEIYARAVPTGQGAVRKMVVPRNTEFTVNGLSFTMLYPIEIRIMSHGGLQVVYDTDSVSPLETLASNVVNWSTMHVDGLEYLRLNIPMSQVKIDVHTKQLSAGARFRQTFGYEHQFYYARAWYSDPQGRWREMRVTHSDQVYDPTTPTLVLQVVAGSVTAEVPLIYLTQNMVTSELKIQIYTTVGPVNVDLAEYQPRSFGVRWVDHESTVNDVYQAALIAMQTTSLFSTSHVDGGENGLSFEQLRTRVIANAMGAPNVPITNIQLTNRMEMAGYKAVKDIDLVTNRQFLATRRLPPPNDGSIVGSAGATIHLFESSMDALAEHPNVMDNGNRLTILPSMLYRLENGQISTVEKSIVDTLLSVPADVRARLINENEYLYSPFHYVMDLQDHKFDLRAYYLDNPMVVNQIFLSENDTTNINVTISSKSITRLEDGYMLMIICSSGDNWKALNDFNAICQLSFIPAGERDRAYQNGFLAGYTDAGERIYTFKLGTNYDIDENNRLTLNTFSMYGNPAGNHPTSLTTDFDVVFAGVDLQVPGLETSIIDTVLGREVLPNNTTGITHERLSLKLGHDCEHLWSPARSVVTSEDYARHQADVPWVHERTVFERDPVTGTIKIERDPETQELVYVVLHEAGDPVLDQEGNPTYKARVGDVMLDADARPVAISSRKMLRHCYLTLLEGAYYFATEAAAAAYRDSLPRTIISWLESDMASLANYLLERTEVFFHPISTLGSVKAIVENGKEITLPAAQSFQVKFYVSGVVYRDGDLRQALRRMAIQTIDDVLQNSVVALNDIVSRITAQAGSDIVGVEVTGLGGETTYSTITMRDDSARLSIRKICEPLANASIAVSDDVEVAFVHHSVV